MLKPAFAQPLQKRTLGGLTLIPQYISHITTLFVLCRQSCSSTKVALVSEHDEKFRLLAVRSMVHDPGRNLGRGRSPFRRAALTDGARGAEHSERCDGSCHDEQ